ncbi:MAG: RNA polymerase sigma factor [Xanthomonadales bacterium]|nr:RNA polymerase sigma factor [Xanthomonadales bacterium]
MLNQHQQSATDADESLNDFLAAVEKRAWQMAWLATHNRDDALDAVQDSMLAFVKKYADKPAAERRPLFYRILSNRLRDYGRRQTTRKRWVSAWFSWFDEDQQAQVDWEPPDVHGELPEQALNNQHMLEATEALLRSLPSRQREAFLLREWEGLDVARTATAMGVTPGSVKTHYFRAIQKLRTALEDFR